MLLSEIFQIQNRITVLIAHRLSTVMHADKIFVLEQGKIIEQGKHEDLLMEKGLVLCDVETTDWGKEIDLKQVLQTVSNSCYPVFN
jgi:ABC-type bacteriocin/lantibiotic exporter with double-glycine peptidase domain